MPNIRLRDAIHKNGLTPSTLADCIGVDAKTVERWISRDWIGARFGHAGVLVPVWRAGWWLPVGQAGVGIQGLPVAAWMRASRLSMPCLAAVAM